MKSNNLNLFKKCEILKCFMSFVFLCFFLHATGQCPPGDLTLSTQSEIDDFPINYPGCTTIDGDLIISGVDIEDLSGLSQLEAINNSFDIDNCPDLVDLQGLENLTYIGYHLWIKNNASLENFDGLGLETLGWWLDITNNAALENVHGLGSMTSFGEGIFENGAALNIIDNDALIDLEGLEGIVEITEHIAIYQNASLLSLSGLQNIISLKSYLQLSDNPLLVDISALAGIDPLTIYNEDFPGIVELRIQNNASLSDCAIQSVCDFFDITDPDYNAQIFGNTGDCIDQSAVEAACDGLVCMHPDFNALMALYDSTDGANWLDNTGWVDGAADIDCDPCSWYGVTCDVFDRVVCLDLDGSLGCNSGGITAGNGLDGMLPAQIMELTSLEYLYIEGNGDLTGVLIPEFYDLLSLKVFDSNLTGLTGEITTDISKLINLEQFTTGFNSIGGFIPSEFGDLLNLTNLNLQHANFFGEIPASLGNLVNITEIRLNDNQLSGCFPPELSIFCPLLQAEFGNNPGLPGGGDFDAFCASGEGTCLNCFPTLAGPEIGGVTTEDYSTGGGDWTRYNLPVTNWAIYPHEMFDAAPNLPPCGSNTNASRSWVSIYDNFDNYIYGFCALTDPMEMQDIWFAMPQGVCPPEFVFVEIHDRACDNYYYSELIDLTCLVGCDELLVNNFDNGWQGWVDGGSDCRRSLQDAPFAFSGNRCVRLRDGSTTSMVTSTSFDASTKTSLVVSFTYITESMDNPNEGFLLEYSTDGINYNVVGDYFQDSNFSNGVREFETVEIFGFFSSITSIRFRCLGSSNNDYVYIDDVEVHGCGFTGGCVSYDSNEFDSGWGIWNDGGSDCRRSAQDAAFAFSGDRCVRLRDDEASAVMTTDDMNASLYSEGNISFTYITDGMDANEGFAFEYSTDGGVTFIVEREWFLNSDFTNGVREFTGVSFFATFTDETQFRFRSMSSSNGDRVYIDDVVIEFCDGEFARPDNEISLRENTQNLDFSIYPNPASSFKDLHLEVGSSAENVELRILDITGNTVMNKLIESKDFSRFQFIDGPSAPGSYLIQITDGSKHVTKKVMIIE